MKPEGPVIDGIDRLIAWCEGTVTRTETKVESAAVRAERFVDDVWWDARFAFWLAVVFLVLYSPPVRWLCTRKPSA